MRHHDKYLPTTEWTIAKGIREEDSLNIILPSYGRVWTYPRQIISLWNKSVEEDKETSYENEVCDKLCYLGIIPPIKYATCTDGTKLFTEEQEIIVHTSWNFIFETKDEADSIFRQFISKYAQLFERIIASEHEMILQAKQALAY